MSDIEDIFWSIISNKIKVEEYQNIKRDDKDKLSKIYNKYYNLIWSKLEPVLGQVYEDDSKLVDKLVLTILRQGKHKTNELLDLGYNINYFKDVSKFSVVYQIEKKLFEEKSKFQIVQVFKTKNFGNMLVIDNDVQLTESDEANYHEMIAHVPINYFNRDINVLIIGGGDGGTAREVLRHNNVKKLVMVDIDEVVVKACKLHFPNFEPTFRNPRLDLIIGDGFKYVKEYKGEPYDLVIIDSTDFNQSIPLFTREFYENTKKIVNKEDYLICFNADNINWNENNIKKMVKEQYKIFNYVYPFGVYIPTFAGGFYSFCLVSDVINPIEGLIDWEYFNKKNISMKYYTQQIHLSSFNMPKSLEKKIKKYQRVEVNNNKGVHYLIDFDGLPFKKLNNLEYLKNIFEQAIKIADLKIIGTNFHKFEPQGLTGVYLLSESHLSFHTWPEKGQFSLDLYSCSKFEDTRKGINYILEIFKEYKYKLNKICR